MTDYKKLYYELFNRLTDTIRAIDERNYEQARELLVDARRAAEESYISGEKD